MKGLRLGLHDAQATMNLISLTRVTLDLDDGQTMGRRQVEEWVNTPQRNPDTSIRRCRTSALTYALPAEAFATTNLQRPPDENQDPHL
jgi:hypothetical protein